MTPKGPDGEIPKEPTRETRNAEPEVAQQQAVASEQAAPTVAAEQTTLTVPEAGRRPALRYLRRELLDTDLAHPGVQKLLLDRVDSSESECEELREYVERFHAADKKAAVLESKLQQNSAFEFICNACFGCGGVLIGIAPSLFDTHIAGGAVVLIVGVAFIIVSTVARIKR